MTWRSRCQLLIARIISECGDNEKLMRKKFRDEYPFGAKELWPYKVWRDEIKKQLEFRERFKKSGWYPGGKNED
jgi:hypothetical protein